MSTRLLGRKGRLLCAQPCRGCFKDALLTAFAEAGVGSERMHEGVIDLQKLAPCAHFLEVDRHTPLRCLGQLVGQQEALRAEEDFKAVGSVDKGLKSGACLS